MGESAVSDDLAILYEVQQADIELARLQAALAGLDAGDELAAQAAEAEAELAKLREELHATENESMDRDLELKALEEKRERFQRELYSGAVRNPRQLSDLEREVQMLSREIGKVEDRILELMELLESKRSSIQEREAELKSVHERVAAARSKYETTGSRLQREIAELEARREERASGVGARLLKRYEQIRVRQGNLGLVRVTGTTCAGCRIALPSETVKGLKAGRRDLTCENCARLLFWDEEGD